MSTKHKKHVKLDESPRTIDDIMMRLGTEGFHNKWQNRLESLQNFKGSQDDFVELRANLLEKLNYKWCKFCCKWTDDYDIESMFPKGTCHCAYCKEAWWYRKQISSTLYNEYSMNVPEEKVYEYFITFTRKPNIDDDKQDKYFDMVMCRHKTLMIVEAQYTYEHEDTNRHIHMYLKTKKPMKKNRFITYEKQVGTVNFQKLKGTRADCLDYMSKENTLNIWRPNDNHA